MTRVGRYAAEIQTWLAAGRPVRSDERVREIYETICRPCEHFNQERERCKACGCKLGLSRRALFNKLRMATTSCPLDEPKWIAEVPMADDDQQTTTPPVLDPLNKAMYRARKAERYFALIVRVENGQVICDRVWQDFPWDDAETARRLILEELDRWEAERG